MSFFEFPHTRTYDTDLGWLIKDYKTINEALKTLDQWLEEYQPKIDELYNIYEMVKNGYLPEEIKEAIYKWCETHLLDLVAQTFKTVIFGLTQDGHFTAIYTDSWSDITFNTTEYDIFTPLQTQFGHLTLSI